ncbi:DHS-like NAD/FAD-binding domain-containing protein [Thozetella sp. PMI_491]|nr:DHS-like NAD/FAD-binding domain-containing protein [Thozetella sp. PMI_491]
MSKPLYYARIPYKDVFAKPDIIPRGADTLEGAVAALREFFKAPLQKPTVVLSGAGLSVASGLADYRGPKGTYRVNKNFRPIFYQEFTGNHEARKRYWARSFLGWPTLSHAKPNKGHHGVASLARLGLVSSVITQNVDSFHPTAHPEIPTIELHGYLRSVVCTSCRSEFPRAPFQEELARLNPRWAAFLAEAIAEGAFDTENPEERRSRGIRSNPDGDIDVPDAPYSTFRYPACPTCLSNPPPKADGSLGIVEIDNDGAWQPRSSGAILKPAVVMFGESINDQVKKAAEVAIDGAGRLLILGTSLATYSAWRLAKKAKDMGMPIAIVNMGGVRGENILLEGVDPHQNGAQIVRTEILTEELLPLLVEELQREAYATGRPRPAGVPLERNGGAVFKDMLS